MLKADLHLHTGEDAMHPEITYSSKELIDYAADLGFKVLSITNHNIVHYNRDLASYAKKKGILLIPGVELKVDHSHVLIHNIKQEDIAGVKTFKDLEILRKRKPHAMITAAHPYYPLITSMGYKLLYYMHLFDAIEYCHFYLKFFNTPNKRAARTAHKFHKPLVGTSDAHHLWRLNTTYTLINAKQKTKSVIENIKKGNIALISKHLSLRYYIKVALSVFYSGIYRKIYGIRE